MEELTICPECGEKSVYHNKGITKQGIHAGKPWENYKCSKCPYIKWINLNKVSAQQINEAKNMGMPETLNPKWQGLFDDIEEIGKKIDDIAADTEEIRKNTEKIEQ